MNKCHDHMMNYQNDQAPPLNDTNMNYMDGCIETLDNRVVAMDTSKANQSDLLLVSDTANEALVISYNLNRRTRRNITNDLSNLATAVSECNLAKYGYSIGDYFERTDGTRTYTYVLADLNTFYSSFTYNQYCIGTNHLGIVVITGEYSVWHTGSAASVGYAGSALHTYLSGTVLDNIKNDMIALFGGTTGLEHLNSHTKWLSTRTNGAAWRTNQYISALTCTQIDAGSQCSMNGYQEGEASKSLELFRKFKWTEIFGGQGPWLRNLGNNNQDDTSAEYACIATAAGLLIGTTPVDIGNEVVGLIVFH